MNRSNVESIDPETSNANAATELVIRGTGFGVEIASNLDTGEVIVDECQ